MVTRFDDPSVVHHVDDVGAHRGGEPVGDEKSRAAGAQRSEASEPVGFGPRIHRARRLVEHENRRLAHERAGERDPLPFSTTELGAVGKRSAKQALVSVGKTTDDLVGSSRFGCRANVGVTGRRRIGGKIVEGQG